MYNKSSLLTSREIEVVAIYAKEGNSRGVARILCITIKMVEAHMAHITRKLGVDGIIQAITQLIDEIEIVLPEISCVEITPREMEVLALIKNGMNNYEVAQKLSISKRTVEYHVSNILSKSGLLNKCQLLVHARLCPNKFVYRAR